MIIPMLIETIGTFFIVFTSLSMLHNPLSIGLVFVALAYIHANTIYGYFNPALLFALFLQKKYSFLFTFYLLCAQIAGAMIAHLFWLHLSGAPYTLAISAEEGRLAIGTIEALFVFILCAVVLQETTQEKNSSALHIVMTGVALSAIHFFGNTFNPATAIGSMVISHLHNDLYSLKDMLTYTATPFFGSILAYFYYKKIASKTIQQINSLK